ncbi:glycosyltransferase family 2 protein [Pseudoroseicyclus tamaricis]|uniref:Glycosyltransferase family 2 protein n=1 Tax=Pseudoroseicyclus tamaricis TaxID=2705421 RepID=A0A6B2JMN6_9RHOB|nr:glycosyltransferase [Pseudoroseicyclus tamaricis]NDV02851.1 glycosyltransferase family 2 protein [Pseudoroseicyclus tamaricis]
MRTSVIVVSHGRSQALARALTALEQLTTPEFELVVVADGPGIAAAGRAGRIKAIRFDEANISAARNLGLAAAAGEAVAFLDDDAVPLPDWLDRLVAPLSAGAAASTGYVIGRNGFTFQHRARRIRADATHLPLPDAPGLYPPEDGAPVKTEGTNMAFRRAALAAIGGFDPAYRFYLDEADVNLRLMAPTAVVPEAIVHHGFMASARRRDDRVPLDLTEIGASLVVFLRRHGADEATMARRIFDQLAEEQSRIFRHLRARRISRRKAREIVQGFVAGTDAGKACPLPPLAPLTEVPPPWLPFHPACTGATRRFSGRPWSLPALRKEAAAAVAGGHRAELFVFSPSTLYHRLSFTGAGVWEQRGGLWGKAGRNDPLVQVATFATRLRRESAKAPLRAAD